MTNYPTDWQRRVLWTVFTSLAIIALGAVAALLLVLLGRVAGFLQPVLIPFAVACVLAFLLDPLVRILSTKTRLSRMQSVLLLFVVVALLVSLMLVSVVPQIYGQTVRMVQEMPEYAEKAQNRLTDLLDASQKKINQLDHLIPGAGAVDQVAAKSTSGSRSSNSAPGHSQNRAQSAGAPAGATSKGNASGNPAAGTDSIRDYLNQQIPALGKEVPLIADSAWHFLIHSIGGVLGVFGAMLSAVIIPVYLYFLLVEGRNIARWWSEYLPIRDSPFKQEVVSVLLEINGYLTAFFRGQLLVSTIDAILIGSCLYFFLHLDFAFFIALLVLVLTFIPYLGIMLCYIPALLIAIIQYGDWQHPFYAVLIMFVAQTLEGTIISPYIVGDAVGLHPMTVIISVFGWSLLLNGPIGAILAVPLSATVKVLLRRYVWEKGGARGRHLLPVSPAAAATLQMVARETEEAKARQAAEQSQPESSPGAAPVTPVAPAAPTPPADMPSDL